MYKATIVLDIKHRNDKPDKLHAAATPHGFSVVTNKLLELNGPFIAELTDQLKDLLKVLKKEGFSVSYYKLEAVHVDSRKWDQFNHFK